MADAMASPGERPFFRALAGRLLELDSFVTSEVSRLETELKQLKQQARSRGPTPPFGSPPPASPPPASPPAVTSPPKSPKLDELIVPSERLAMGDDLDEVVCSTKSLRLPPIPSIPEREEVAPAQQEDSGNAHDFKSHGSLRSLTTMSRCQSSNYSSSRSYREVVQIGETVEDFKPVQVINAPSRSERPRSPHSPRSPGTFRNSVSSSALILGWTGSVTSKFSRQHTQRLSNTIFQLHPGWQVDLDTSDDASVLMGADRGTSVKFQELKASLKAARTPLFHPMSIFCSCWEAVLVSVIAYDFVMVPVHLAFEPQDHIFTSVMTWFVRACWTISILLNCVVGYVKLDGTVELNPSRIMLHYVQTWALFDIIVVTNDWLSVILEGIGFLKSVGWMKLLRALRVIRVFRLVRVLKQPVLLERINKRSFFEKAELAVVFLKTAAGMLGLAHCIACIWFVIGREPGGWVENYGFQDKTAIQQYTVSLHWALTQFIGNVDVTATTHSERSYSVCTLGMCFFVSACFVSEITASLTRLSIVSGRQGRQFAVLRQYLGMHRISPGLQIRVVKAAQYQAAQHERNLPESEVELLGILSDPLKAEIHYEVNVPVFTYHPFFHYYQHACPQAMRKLCHLGVQPLTLDSQDVVFVEGERQTVPKMYLFRTGKLAYTKAMSARTRELKSGDYACEVALWTSWVHRGQLQALTACNTLTLDTQTFIEIANQLADRVFHAAMYAQEFVKRLNQLMEETDNVDGEKSIPIDDVDFGDMPIQDILSSVFPTMSFYESGSGGGGSQMLVGRIFSDPTGMRGGGPRTRRA